MKEESLICSLWGYLSWVAAECILCISRFALTRVFRTERLWVWLLCQLLFAHFELKNVNPQWMLHQNCHISLEELCLSASYLLFSLKWKSVQEKAEFFKHAYGLLLIVVQRNYQIVNLFLNVYIFSHRFNMLCIWLLPVLYEYT